jgi:hypothetical protein
MSRTLGFALALGVCVTGCTQAQLQHDAVGTSQVVMEIHQQQVLDNLAMFVVDYNAFPSFALPNQGSAQVADTGAAVATPAFGRPSAGGPFKFSAFGLSLTAQRQATDAYTLQPINDPRKLELMRCAYQQAVATLHPEAVSKTCPDCQASFNTFYTGDANKSIHETASKGGVTSECLKSEVPWFQCGPKKCVPKGCVPVGCYCGTYVWVTTPEGRDQLTKLTLAILDYAVNSPPARINKTVSYYIDEYGLPTNRNLAVGTVAATIGVDENSASLLNNPHFEELRLERIITGRLEKVENELRRTRPPNGEELRQLLAEKQTLQNKLQYLNEQLSIPGLKREFEPVRPLAVGGAALPLSQSLQTLAPTPMPAMGP